MKSGYDLYSFVIDKVSGLCMYVCSEWFVFICVNWNSEIEAEGREQQQQQQQQHTKKQEPRK